MSERVVLMEARYGGFNEEADRFRVRFNGKLRRDHIIDMLGPEVPALKPGALYRIVAEEIPVKVEPQPE